MAACLYVFKKTRILFANKVQVTWSIFQLPCASIKIYSGYVVLPVQAYSLRPTIGSVQ